MADQFIDNKAPLLGAAIQRAANRPADFHGSPLARYVEDAAQVFGGIESALSLVTASALRRERREHGDEDELPLSPYDESNLVGLARTASKMMLGDAWRLSEWADEYLFPQEDRQ